jgi:Pyruvate/2-oxoglutarate dehydrogenase complex, dehydrogenase (E1) component, eukaryotic type, beta subunit
VVDPYGGAFKATRGLSTRYPGRVLSTPLSEGAIVGAAAGLALAGDRVIAEIMFGDFVTLCFDHLVNFASKSVTMYGRRLPMHLVVRCPVGGNRGYGPTHSQSPQKHFLGVPNLALYEMSPFHDNTPGPRPPAGAGRAVPVLRGQGALHPAHARARAGGRPAPVRPAGPEPGVARVFVEDPDDFDQVVIAPAGGPAGRRRDPSPVPRPGAQHPAAGPLRAIPVRRTPLLPMLARARRVLVVEESVAGGTWGSEVAHLVHERLWGTLRRPVRLVHSADSIIPTASHLERRVLVQEQAIYDALQEDLDA